MLGNRKAYNMYAYYITVKLLRVSNNEVYCKNTYANWLVRFTY